MSYSSIRTLKLRKLMQEKGFDVFYLRDLSNILWICAFDGVFDDEPAHALVVTADKALLHTDSRYAEACKKAARGTSIDVDHARVSGAEFLAERLADRAAGRYTLALEDSISLGEFRRIEKALAEKGVEPDIVETSGVVVGLRSVKDEGEVRRMRAAQAITDAAFAHIVSFMKPGMTERAVQRELEDFMLRAGAEGLAFSSIVATGANGASPHAIPGETVLEAGQCVVLDFGARAQGYCSDMTRTVFLGAPDAEMAAAYAAIRAANEEVEALLKPGVTGAEAQQLAEKILEDAGFGGAMGHSLGHGVGIDVHEEPVLATRNTAPLVQGNVVTVEPGIYLSGKFGMRLEDFGVITNSGFDVFTQSGHDMVII